MTVFIDTSAFYAVLDRDDANHLQARDVWAKLLAQEQALFTSNYVLVETIALLQSRLGINALRAFHENVLPLLVVEWMSEERHRAGIEAVLAAGRKKLSLVDCLSFQVMRERGVDTAFCFDSQFREQGFRTMP